MEVTRVEQRAYIKIAILQGKNEMECHSEFVVANEHNALPYRTVARWVGKFHQGRVSTSDEHRSRRPLRVRIGTCCHREWMKSDDRDNKDRSRNAQQKHRHVNFMCTVLSFFCAVKAILPWILP
ncbi:HTH_48 domain-containing protein [Trichonephila clavata]|uniref:HTH_48 domain-containing protein n=1 Tax=Trichonephila clavata TaxID=2740835 RepID=A0A8X6F1D8_TRICU|nr:HTH_48 domain-containing protein [Trichonephila clavata]